MSDRKTSEPQSGVLALHVLLQVFRLKIELPR